MCRLPGVVVSKLSGRWMIRIVVTATASSRNQSLIPETNEPSKIWTSSSGTLFL